VLRHAERLKSIAGPAVAYDQGILDAVTIHVDSIRKGEIHFLPFGPREAQDGFDAVEGHNRRGIYGKLKRGRGLLFPDRTLLIALFQDEDLFPRIATRDDPVRKGYFTARIETRDHLRHRQDMSVTDARPFRSHSFQQFLQNPVDQRRVQRPQRFERNGKGLRLRGKSPFPELFLDDRMEIPILVPQNLRGLDQGSVQFRVEAPHLGNQRVPEAISQKSPREVR